MAVSLFIIRYMFIYWLRSINIINTIITLQYPMLLWDFIYFFLLIFDYIITINIIIIIKIMIMIIHPSHIIIIIIQIIIISWNLLLLHYWLNSFLNFINSIIFCFTIHIRDFCFFNFSHCLFKIISLFCFESVIRHHFLLSFFFISFLR